MSKGTYSTTNIDSLSAFWPGLQVVGLSPACNSTSLTLGQVLAGDIQNAIKSHIICQSHPLTCNVTLTEPHRLEFMEKIPRNTRVVRCHDKNSKNRRLSVTSGIHREHIFPISSTYYPLLPAFIPSHSSQATRDTFYLDVGMEVLADLTARSKVECGLATLADVETDELDDRMESFVLSETLKYLYLLFDEDNEFSNSDSNFIFTTEGHILMLNSTHLNPISETRRRARRHERPQCPVHQPVIRPHAHGLVYGIRGRPEYEYARHLAGNDMFGDVANGDSKWWDAHGICEVPKVDVFVSVSLPCQVSRINSHPCRLMISFWRKKAQESPRIHQSSLYSQKYSPGWTDSYFKTPLALGFLPLVGLMVGATISLRVRSQGVFREFTNRIFPSWQCRCPCGDHGLL